MDEPFIEDDKTFCTKALNLGLLAIVLLTLSFGIYVKLYVNNILVLSGLTLLFIISCMFASNKFIIKLHEGENKYNRKSKLINIAVIVGICSFLICVLLILPKEFVIVILTQNTLLDICLLIAKDKINSFPFDFMDFLHKLIGALLVAIFGILLVICFLYTNVPLMIYVFINILSLSIIQI